MHTHTLYRVDGSYLKGEITAWNEDYVTIKLLNGVSIDVKEKDIRKVISKGMKKARPGDTETQVESTHRFHRRGLYNVTTLGLSSGSALGIGLTHAAGYRFSRMLGFGGGFGIETFDVSSGNEIVPVFAEIRGFLLDRAFTPYYALRAGHGFALAKADPETFQESAKGGRMLQAEAGYRLGWREASVMIGAGIHFQKEEHAMSSAWATTLVDRGTHRRTELRMAVIF